MQSVLLIYSSTDGHTLDICCRLKQVIEKDHFQVTLLSIDDEMAIDLNGFDKIVIGASIRYGKHKPKIYQFIRDHLQLLDSKPNAFFSVNVVARKAEKNTPDTNPYLRKFLRQISWEPKKLAVFAGKIDYQKYSFWDRFIIRLIMRITHGPTDPSTNIDFTDWKQVEGFAKVISVM